MTEAQRERFAEALARLSKDEDLLIAMGAIVIDDAPSIVRDMDKQLAGGKLSDVASTAHKLKGLMSTFETNDVVSTIQDLIYAAKSKNQDECGRLWAACQPKLARLLGEIRAIVDPIAT